MGGPRAQGWEGLPLISDVESPQHRCDPRTAFRAPAPGGGFVGSAGCARRAVWWQEVPSLSTQWAGASRAGGGQVGAGSLAGTVCDSSAVPRAPEEEDGRETRTCDRQDVAGPGMTQGMSEATFVGSDSREINVQFFLLCPPSSALQALLSSAWPLLKPGAVFSQRCFPCQPVTWAGAPDSLGCPVWR